MLTYSTLSYHTPPCSNLSYLIFWYFILSYLSYLIYCIYRVLSYLICSSLILTYLSYLTFLIYRILSYIVLTDLASSCIVLSRPLISHSTLSYTAIDHLIISYRPCMASWPVNLDHHAR